MSNSLVAERQESTGQLAGTLLIEDGEALVKAFESKDWVSGGVALFSTALDIGAAVLDPLGTLIAMGLGWLIEHVHPLDEWLDAFTGDADQVAAYSATWKNIHAQLAEAGTLLQNHTRVDLSDMRGETIQALNALEGDIAKTVEKAGRWADAMGTALEVAASLVQVVHDLVRDALSQIIGAFASALIEAVATAGLALPAIIQQVTAKVSSLATRISETINKVIESIGNLKGLLGQLAGLFDKVSGLLNQFLATPGGQILKDVGTKLLTTGGNALLNKITGGSQGGGLFGSQRQMMDPAAYGRGTSLNRGSGYYGGGAYGGLGYSDYYGTHYASALPSSYHAGSYGMPGSYDVSGAHSASDVRMSHSAAFAGIRHNGDITPDSRIPVAPAGAEAVHASSSAPTQAGRLGFHAAESSAASSASLAARGGAAATGRGFMVPPMAMAGAGGSMAAAASSGSGFRGAHASRQIINEENFQSLFDAEPEAPASNVPVITGSHHTEHAFSPRS
ncbi:MAG: hypothetical protein E6448_08270 [Actinomyces sp.]|nr:hypothetical protein [Actinomyces sp.]